MTCFRAAVKDISGHTNALGRARKILKGKLQTPELVPAASGVKASPGRHPAYWEKTEGVRSYTIRVKAFRGWFDSPAQMTAILRWLHQEGLLIEGRRTFKPSLTSGQWAVRAHRWPGGKVVKSIRMQDPFPAKVGSLAI